MFLTRKIDYFPTKMKIFAVEKREERFGIKHF